LRHEHTPVVGDNPQRERGWRLRTGRSVFPSQPAGSRIVGTNNDIRGREREAHSGCEDGSSFDDQRSDRVAAAARIHAILPSERSGAGIVGTDNPVQVAPSIGAGTADDQQPVSRCHRRAARNIGPPSEVEDVSHSSAPSSGA
jgi:hypothetical protein